jgi:hypothetical protein
MIQLTFFNTHAGLADKRTFKRFIGPLWHSKWVVYCKALFAGPKQVLRYLSVTRTVSPSRTAASLRPMTPMSGDAGTRAVRLSHVQRSWAACSGTSSRPAISQLAIAGAKLVLVTAPTLMLCEPSAAA